MPSPPFSSSCCAEFERLCEVKERLLRTDEWRSGHREKKSDDADAFASKQCVRAANNATRLARATFSAVEKESKVRRAFGGGGRGGRDGGDGDDDDDDGDEERRRDEVEREMGDAIEQCAQYVCLCERVVAKRFDNASSRRRRSQVEAHLLGVALIASERVAEAARMLDDMRRARAKQHLELKKAEERRRGGKRVGAEGVALEIAPSSSSMRLRRGSESNGANGEVDAAATKKVEEGGGGFAQQRQQQQQQRQETVETETDALIAELVDVSRASQLTESKMTELLALTSMFANVVSQQSRQIEQIYSEALKSTKFLEIGNVEMRKTISRRRSGSSYIAFVLFVATFAVLFLDWFST